MQNKNERTGGVKFLFPLLVMLINPAVRLVDIFPDFIPCFLLASTLAFYAERVPHLAEARDSLLKLGWLSLLRIPAFMIAAAVKSANVADNDMTVLFTFLFAIGEAYLLILTLKHLFEGLSYLGMRGDVGAIAPFEARRGRTMTPDRLKALAYSFAVFKAASSALPEMLLLSRTDEIGVTTRLFNFRALYPYFVVVLVPLVFILGILLARLFARYIRAITKEDGIRQTAESLIDDGMRRELDKKRRVKRVSGILSLIFAATVLSVDIRLGELSMIDLFPSFIPACLFFIAVFRMTRETKKELLSLVALSAYGIFSALAYFVEFGFLDVYGYAALEKNAAAAELYRGVILTSAIELVSLLFATVALALSVSILLKRCGVTATDPSAPEFSRRKRSELTLKTIIFSILNIALGAAKFLYVLFNYYTKSTLVATDGGAGAVAAGLVPWFGTLVFALWIALAGYAYFYTAHLKEEISLKLS